MSRIRQAKRCLPSALSLCTLFATAAVLVLVCAAAAQSPASAPSDRSAIESVTVRFADGQDQRFVPAATTDPATQPATVPFRRPRSLLGVNIEALRDHARAEMYIDAIKSARVFGSAAEPWAGRPRIDERGWPLEDFGVVVMTEAVDASGVYRLSCQGYAQVRTIASKASVKNWNYDAQADRTTAEIHFVADPSVPSPLHLSFTGTRGSVRDLKLLRPGYESDDAIFTRRFLAALEPFGTIRFMDYLRTNHSTQVEWSDRAHPDDAQYTRGRGGPYEHAIALGNLAGKDIWLNIPVSASDSYVEHLAILLRDTLAADVNCYLEYSNELWNGIFDQEQTNLDLARAQVAAGDTSLSREGAITNPYYWAWRRTGQRTLQIARIMQRVCGRDPRIRIVLCGQHVQPLVAKKALEYIREYGGPPGDFVYGLASAPYFGNDRTLLQRTDLSVDEICALLLSRVTAGNNAHVQNLIALAREHGLRPIAYEGGVDLGQGTASLVAKIDAQFDPRTGEAVERYLRNWFEAGGELFVYYNLTNRNTKSGVWGLTDSVSRLDVPKMLAARRVAESLPAP